MTTADQFLAETVARMKAKYEWLKLRVGPDADEAGEWIPLESFAVAELRERGVAAVRAGEPEVTLPAPRAGNELFETLTYSSLLLIGYCFADTRRVLLPAGAFEVRLDELGPLRVRAHRFAVLPGDALAGQPDVEVEPDLEALTARLFSEVQGLLGPVIDSFRPVKYVAPANAWASILDFLLGGFLLAGRIGLGGDEAWARWETAIEGRSFPVRRRPRRLFYEWAPGEQDDLMVRSGCCLWYTTDEAKASPDEHYCTTCYLETDERRIQNMVAWKQKVAAGDAVEE